jgi:predicted DsbA family dithiol-disulfide isomerase
MENQQEVKKASLNIVYYTDPLCCWSWTFEPVIAQLKKEFADILNIRYCMSGMLADWKNYHDALNAVSRPVQMGPVWLQAKQMAGIYLNDRIWFTDPPASSYPACAAVKCAALQSAVAEELYLYKVREAVMTKEKNIAKREVLLALAQDLATEYPDVFDAVLFEQQLNDERVVTAFKSDLQETQYRNITRFPTLLISSADKKKSVLLTGNRPYEAVKACIEQL